MPTCLVTGVTGYVGSWVCNAALEAGFTVVGTARDIKNAKAQFLHDAIAGKQGTKFCAAAKTNLSLYQIDLLSSQADWDKLFDQYKFDIVMHTASPYVLKQPKDPQVLIRPAVDGTTRVMTAAGTHGVTRIVVTSSMASVIEPLTAGKKYSSADWSEPDKQGPYMKSKTLAERKAWEIAKQYPSMQLVTLCPSGIRGPSLYTDKSFLDTYESGAIGVKMLSRGYNTCPKLRVGVIDVRDLAQMHVLAATQSCAVGKRFIASGSTLWFKDVVGEFEKQFPGYGVKAKEAPNWLVGLMAPAVKDFLGKSYEINVEEITMRGGLAEEGFTLTPLSKTIKDMGDDIVALGAVQKPSHSGGGGCIVS